MPALLIIGKPFSTGGSALDAFNV